jgi:hypothetical protein
MSQNDSWVWNLAHDESVWPESLPARTSTMSLELERPAMQDVVMLLFTVVFFALAFLYVKACQKLR